MVIEVTYNVTDVYMSTTVSPIYITVDYSGSGSSGASVWGSITGTLSNQTDLQTALAGKFDDPTGTTSQYLRGDGSLATFPSLTGYVPYSGATSAVDLGEYGISAGQVTLDVSPTGTAAVGTTQWNDTIGSSQTTLKGGSVVLKNGVDLVARIVNKVSPNTTLTKAAYQAVRVSGAQGQRLAVAFAQANNDNNSADTIGLVIETIATNQEGFIITVGQIDGINTTGSLQGETWADGDVLYLSPTVAGALTNVKPTGATGHIVIIGYVEYAHANNGKIYVKVMNGWELDELHNVYISSVANNQGLFYESSSSLWKNKSISTILGYTPEQPLTFSSPLSRSTNTVSIPAASSSANGYLSSTDWSTFNSKQNALTNPVTGTGTSNELAYFSGTSAISSLTTATYPSLTELSYVKGVTSSVQTQLNAKQGTLTLTTTGTSGAATLVGSTLNIPQYSGGGGMAIGGSITSATAGSVLFAGTSGVLAQNNANFFWDNTNGRLGLGTSSPSASAARLTISYSDNSYNQGFLIQNTNTGTTAITGMLLQAQSTLVGGFSYYPSNYNITGLQNTVVFSSVTSQKLGFQANAAGNNGVPQDIWFSTYGTNTTYQMQIKANGNVQINTNTDAGYRLDVNGTSRHNGQTTLTGSVTASSALAQGVITTPTLVAAANNDVLIGLDVNPTFTNGAFTGVSNIGARMQSLLIGSTLLNTNTTLIPLQVNLTNVGNGVNAIWRNGSATGYVSFRFYNDQNSGSRALELGYSGSSYSGSILSSGATGESAYLTTTGNYPLGFGVNNTAYLTISGGNILINTVTNAGYRIDVNGTARIQAKSSSSSTSSLVIGDNIAIATATSRSKLLMGNTSENSEILLGQSSTNGLLLTWIYNATSSSAYGTLETYAGNNPLFLQTSGGNVGIGTTTNVASAKLQVSSTTQGFLPPRMTTTQKNAISSPAAGLVVYDTTLNKLCVYTTAWETITSV